VTLAESPQSVSFPKELIKATVFYRFKPLASVTRIRGLLVASLGWLAKIPKPAEEALHR
jgi:hypothetical protein